MCHFDIKEENIFMMNPYTPILGDLGFVQKWKAAKKEETLMGSPLFLGAKVMKTKNLYYNDCKEDMFALGVLSYSIIEKLVTSLLNTDIF